MSMEFQKRFPIWAWWVAGIIAVAALAGGIIFIVRNSGPSLPPGLVEKRAEASRLLEEASRIEDVDVKPLITLEAKKDFAGAVALMDSALAVNSRQEQLNGALVSVSDELAKIAVGVEPDDAGAKAVEAFSILAQLAEAEKKFFTDRRALYEAGRDYYRALAAKKKPSLSNELAALVETITSDLTKAKELHQRFSTAAKAFDEALKARK